MASPQVLPFILMTLFVLAIGVSSSSSSEDRQGRQLFYHPQGPPLPAIIYHHPLSRISLVNYARSQLLHHHQASAQAFGNIEARSRLRTSSSLLNANNNETDNASAASSRDFASTATNAITNFLNNLPGFLDLSSDSSSTTGTGKVYDSCSDTSGLMGICTSPLICSGLRGRAGSGCSSGLTCCTNVLSKCGGQVILNNTYWQSPTNFNSLSCALSINLNKNLAEQPKSICQVRLDFISFSIAQPSSESLCNVDFFQVGGTTNKIPTICGDNAGQHMYLHVPPTASTADLQLLFSFRQSLASKSWNIRISMIPCGANYLAPTGCLQYFTSSAGTIKSFNWKDVPNTQTRQLADQDYKICFRTEQVSGTNAASLCLIACSVTNSGRPFSLSRSTGVNVPAGASQNLPSDCNNDFLLIPGGYNFGLPITSVFNARDRYCGERLNTLATRTNHDTVCTMMQPFSLNYKTNGDETITPTRDTSATGNQGFCLNFQMSPS